MELRHLRYFQAVAEERSFRRAAERLFISQPALSQQIRQLEEEVGVPLFDRIGKRVRPTAAGELLLGYAQRVLHELAEAQRALAEFEGLARGTLALGVVQTVDSYLIPAALARFIPAYPAIAIRIEELPAGRLTLGSGSPPPAQQRSRQSLCSMKNWCSSYVATTAWPGRSACRSAGLKVCRWRSFRRRSVRAAWLTSASSLPALAWMYAWR
ncbi:MAG: hypothetical protein C4289_07695 [Chloroflexota bacterium]